MLSDNIKSQENSGRNARNPSSRASDRRFSEKEREEPTRSSGSSSGSSSASDLKRRLQDLPSPNEAAFVASRAINTSRRLSRKRDLYFYSASNRIEEKEEKEEQESLQPRRSFESKSSDARTRRRARLRSEDMQRQVASLSTSENNSDDNPSVEDTSRSNSQRHNSLSRTPSTLNTHQLEAVDSSARSPKSPLFRVFSKTAILCSPPSKFGGYRPNSGVILHNLSSGSDPGSDHENLTDRTNLSSTIQAGSTSSHNRVSRMPITREVSPSVIQLGSSRSRASNMSTPRNVFPSQIQLGSASSYGRVSRIPTPRDVANDLSSSRDFIVSSGSKLSLEETAKSMNESSVVDEDRRTSRMPFYRVVDRPRSDCCDAKKSTDKINDQRMFLSARDSLRDYRRQTLEPLPPIGNRHIISTNEASAEAFAEVRNYDEEESCKEESLRGKWQVSSSSRSRGNSLDQAASSRNSLVEGSLQSLASVSSTKGSEDLKTERQEILESRVNKSAKGSLQSLASVSLKPGSEDLNTKYQESLESGVTKSAFSRGSSAKGSVQSLASVSLKPESEDLRTQYHEILESRVSKSPFSRGSSAKGSLQSLASVSLKPGSEDLNTKYQESLESGVTKSAFSRGSSAKGSVQSLASVSLKPESEDLRTQYHEILESRVSKSPFSRGSSAKGSVQSLASVSSKKGSEDLRTQYREVLESGVTKSAFSRGSSAKGSLQSLASVSSKPGSEDLKTQCQEIPESRTTTSKCLLDLKTEHQEILESRVKKSAKGSLQSLASVSLKPGSEDLRTQYQEVLESGVTKSAFSRGSSAKGSLQSLASVSSKLGSEELKTQYQKILESGVTKSAFSRGSFSKGSVQSPAPVSSKPGSEDLRTQYQEILESEINKSAFSRGSSAKGSLQSLASVSSKLGSEELKTQYQEILESGVTKSAFFRGSSAKGSVQCLTSVSSKPESEDLKTHCQEIPESQTPTSKCLLDQSDIKATKIPLSTSRIPKITERLSPSGFRDCYSERNSEVSSIPEACSVDSKKMDGNMLGRLSSRSQDSREYVNVPSLALNSQDVSSSASSLNKTASRQCANAADLIEALSNMRLTQTENTYRLSPETSSVERENLNGSKKTPKFDEDYKTSPKSRERVSLDPVSLDGQPCSKDLPVSASGSESSLRSEKEFSARNPEDNETCNLSKTVDLEEDAESAKNGAEDDAPEDYERSRNSSSSLLYMDETLRSNASADQEGPNEGSEDSESPRSINKPTDNPRASLNCCEARGSPLNDFKKSNNFPTELNGSFQANHLQSTYEGEVSKKLTENVRHNLLESQMGDGQDAFLEDNKFYSSDTSEDEVLKDEAIEGKVRVSLEKMAAEQFRRNIYAEQARAIQSDTLPFFTEKFYESPIPISQSSSTSKLRYARDFPRFGKKSQDRFPFTMSEKPSVASHKHPGRLESLNEDSKTPRRTYKLDLHPSITRLAIEGFEDTPAEIIDYVSFSEEQRPTRSGMKGLMKKFSARLKKSKKREEEVVAKTTDVLYENRDYQGDSVVDSCSESSLFKEPKSNVVSKNPSKESPDEKSSVVTDPVQTESSKDTLSSIGSCKRRDNLWVREVDPDPVEEAKITETPKRTQDKSRKDPYSVFFVKTPQKETSARKEELPEEEFDKESSARKKNKVKFRTNALKPKASDENVLKGPQRRNSLRNRKEAKIGCLCLRFYRMIIPIARHRSRNRKSSASLSVKKRLGFSPGKRMG